jgi:hypothetical protein
MGLSAQAEQCSMRSLGRCHGLAELRVHAKPIGDLPMPGQALVLEKIEGCSRHFDAVSFGWKTWKVCAVCSLPKPGHHDQIVFSDQCLDGKPLIWERLSGQPNALFVAGKIECLLIPRIAGIMMDGIVRCDVPIGCLDVAVVPDFFNEAG